MTRWYIPALIAAIYLALCMWVVFEMADIARRMWG
jgi:hypothetical protein